MTLWRWLLEFAALATMLMVVLACGAFLQIAMSPEVRVQALREHALGQECVATFKAMTARHKR